MRRSLVICGTIFVLLGSQTAHAARKKKGKKGERVSAAALAAAAAEEAARADMEQMKREAEEAKKPKPTPAPMEPDECEDCLRGTRGQCRNPDNRMCRPKLSSGDCPPGFETCEPEKDPCSEFDNQIECDALCFLANHTNFMNWTDHTGWLEGGTYCDWAGVRCDRRRLHVVELYLDGVGLDGTIPFFDGLYWLEVLSLENNRKLTGTIPSLAGLSALQTLSLGNTGLSGDIPELTNAELREIFLDGCKLEGLIPDLVELKKLSVLQLMDNKLYGTIPSLTDLSNLENLLLHNNKLFGELPPDFNKLTNLKILSLRDNELEGLIPDLAPLKKLKYVHLYNNNFTGVHKGICNLLPFKHEGDCQVQENPFECDALPKCATKCGGECDYKAVVLENIEVKRGLGDSASIVAEKDGKQPEEPKVQLDVPVGVGIAVDEVSDEHGPAAVQEEPNVDDLSSSDFPDEL